MAILDCLNYQTLWICIMATLMFFVDIAESRGNSGFKYRATRFGSYYSSRYYSYSGGSQTARYSRVYSNGKTSLSAYYQQYYNYMFDWLSTDAYTIYKSTPSDYISVCKNYESDSNGTYLGVFTCPLPYVPSSHAYCCGVANAEYCCKFWDVPLNLGGAIIGVLLGIAIFGISVWVIVTLCLSSYNNKKEKKIRKTSRRMGTVRRLGRVSSAWLSFPAMFQASSSGSTHDLVDSDILDDQHG